MALELIANIKGPRGGKGDRGDQGLPGLNAVPTGEGIASHLTTTGPARTALDTVLDRKGGRRSVLDYGAVATNDTDMADSTAAFQAAFAAGERIYIPAGLFYIGAPVIIAPNTHVEAHTAATVKLAPMARCHMFRHDATVAAGANGTFSWNGGTLDGNDANQGDFTLGGAAFDVSKGLVVSKCAWAKIENLTVRRVRGHSINHWNNDVLVARNLRFDQGIDTTQTSGGRRRDGITGSSRIVDIEGVSGYTGDDMVAVLAGAEWGSSGSSGIASVDSVRVVGVRGEVSKQNAGVRTWRGVTLYTKNGYTIKRADVQDVSGVYNLSDVAVLPNKDSNWVTPGTVDVLRVAGVSGRVYNGNEFGSPIYIGETTVAHASVSGVYDFQVAGSGIIESPTLRVFAATITTLQLSQVFKLGSASTVPTVLVSGDARVTTFTGEGVEGPGQVIEKNVTANTVSTLTRGVRTDLVKVTAGNMTSSETFSRGNGMDANLLIHAGVYVNALTAANWPRTSEATGQQMVVSRVGNAVQQKVTTNAGATTVRQYFRSSTDAGATWTAWLPPTA